jgi:hypothetical protein
MRCWLRGRLWLWPRSRCVERKDRLLQIRARLAPRASSTCCTSRPGRNSRLTVQKVQPKKRILCAASSRLRRSRFGLWRNLDPSRASNVGSGRSESRSRGFGGRRNWVSTDQINLRGGRLADGRLAQGLSPINIVLLLDDAQRHIIVPLSI